LLLATWDEIERSWVEKCEENMTWFRPQEVIKEIVDPVVRQIVAKILRGLRGEGWGKEGILDAEELEKEIQRALEDKSKIGSKGSN